MLNKLAQIRYRYVRVQHPDRRSLAFTIYGQSMMRTPRDKLDITQCRSWHPLVIGLGLLQRQQLCNSACLRGFELLLLDPNTVLFFIDNRERKRGLVDSLQGDISALEAQLAELQARQAENADLAQQNRCVSFPITPFARHLTISHNTNLSSTTPGPAPGRERRSGAANQVPFLFYLFEGPPTLQLHQADLVQQNMTVAQNAALVHRTFAACNDTFPRTPHFAFCRAPEA